MKEEQIDATLPLAFEESVLNIKDKMIALRKKRKEKIKAACKKGCVNKCKACQKIK
jgi:hypothetical protein